MNNDIYLDSTNPWAVDERTLPEMIDDLTQEVAFLTNRVEELERQVKFNENTI